MKNIIRISTIIALVLAGFGLLTQCHRQEIEEDATITEFEVGPAYANDNPNIQENHLYRIESQDQMDALFSSYPSNELPNINFDEHTLLVVWGAYCHARRSNTQWIKTDDNNYLLHVTLTPSIDTGPDLRWSFAGITSRKLKANENVVLTIVEEEGISGTK